MSDTETPSADAVAKVVTQVEAIRLADQDGPLDQLSPFRLEELPHEIISSIGQLSNQPRRLRQLCRHLLHTHGPLSSGLHLQGDANFKLLHDILSRDPARYSHTLHLILTLQALSERRPLPPSYSALVEALPQSFPQLQSLGLSFLAPLPLTSLPRLAALATTLTALQFSVEAFPARAPWALYCDMCSDLRHLTSLQCLRSLTIWGLRIQHNGQPDAVTHPIVAQLCQLPLLQSLQLRPLGTRPLPASRWLPGLCALQHLTHLDLGVLLTSWSPASVDALARGFPALQSLALFAPGFDLTSALDALAHRTSLTELFIKVHGMHVDRSPEAEAAVEGLTSLRLARLTVLMGHGGPQLARLLRATAAQQTLACLHFTNSECIPDGATLEALHSMAGTLTELRGIYIGSQEARELCSGLAGLTRLRALGIRGEATGDYAYYEDYAWHNSVAALTALSALRTMTLQLRGLNDVYGAVLQYLPSFPQLVDLELCEANGDAGAAAAAVPAARHALDSPQRACGLHRLLPQLSGQLTRLVLHRLAAPTGPDLAAVRGLCRLEHLRLGRMPALCYTRLHEFLLPLPGALRELVVDDSPPSTGGLALQPAAVHALGSAADEQGCSFRVGQWM